MRTPPSSARPEGAWARVLADNELGSLQPIYDGGIPQLAGLSLPRRDLYPRRYLFDAVVTSKGCPHRCEFCSVRRIYGGRYQTRPVGEVLDELSETRSRFIFFVDDNLTANRRRAIDLCRGMVERRLGKHFAIQTSLEVGQDEELLVWLRQAGCFLVFVGIESTEESTLRRLRKSSNLRLGVERYGEAIAGIQRHGMAVSAGIIFGDDEDTLETFRSLEAFVGESMVDSPVYTILTPTPGTDLWQRLESAGRLRLPELPQGYALFDDHHALFEPARMSTAELQSASRAAVRRATSVAALARGVVGTWRRTGSLLATLAALQNNRWARASLRSQAHADRIATTWKTA